MTPRDERFADRVHMAAARLAAAGGYDRLECAANDAITLVCATDAALADAPAPVADAERALAKLGAAVVRDWYRQTHGFQSIDGHQLDDEAQAAAVMTCGDTVGFRLAPGQSWRIPAGPLWQARLDRGGRAHVVGQALAEHEDYREGYADPGREDAGIGNAIFRELRRGARPWWYVPASVHPAWARPRRWHADFDRACRAAAFHERMVVAAAKQKVGDNA